MSINRERYSNATATTLNGAINNSTTTVIVTDGSTLPSQYFRIIVESEIMFCTSRSSNTLTVLRAQEGTAAASHADTTAVLHLLTAGFFDNFRRDLLGAAGMIDANDSLSTDDDNFDDESFSGWTTVQTTPNCTVTEKSHRASVLIPNGSAASQHYAFMKTKTPPAGGYVQAGFQYGGASGNYPHAHVWMANGVTYGSGKQVGFGWSINENQAVLRGATGYNAQSSFDGGGTQNPYFWPTIHLRLAWESNDHYSAYVSPDAVSWARVKNNTTCNSLGAAPTYCGWGVTSWGASNEFVISCLYCRFSW